jgi:hypothetical protein
MKRIFIVLLILLSQIAFGATNMPQMEEPMYMNADGSLYNPNEVAYPKVTQIEQIVLNKTYENQPIDTRLERLERKIFKRTFSNYSLAQRMDNLTNSVAESSVDPKDKRALIQLETRIFARNYNSDNVKSRIERLERRMFGAAQNGDLTSRIRNLQVAINGHRNYASYNTYTTQQAMPTYTSTYLPSFFPTYRPNYYNYRRPARQNRRPNGYYRYSSWLKPIRAITSYFKGTLTGYTVPVQSQNTVYPQGYNYDDQYYDDNNNSLNTNQNPYYKQPQTTRDIFSNDGTDEFYYDNGEYYRRNSNTSGGLGVTIIDD